MHDETRLTPTALRDATLRRREGMQLQAIEGNPLDAADIAMFEMFEREAWTHERRRAFILSKALVPAAG